MPFLSNKGPWEGSLAPSRASAVGLSPPALRRVGIVGALLLFVVGCGGGSSGNASADGAVYGSGEAGHFVTLIDAGADAEPPPPSLAPTSLGGKIVLPSGFTTVDAGLTVAAVGGTTVPLPDGTFAATGAGNSMQGVLVLDLDGDPVLAGWAKPGKQATLSTTSTAAALLAVYAGIGLYPHSGFEHAIDMLMAAPQTAALAKFLDVKIVANPKFLTLTTAADQQALADAVAQALMGFLPTLRKPHQALVLVNPGDAQSGITVLIGDKDGHSTADVNMITFMNAYRRRAIAFIDRRLTADPATYSQEAQIEIVPTVGLNGLVGTVSDYVSGNVAYAPVYVGPIGLGNVLTEDEVLHYRVRVVGIGLPSGIVLTPEQKSQQTFIAVKAVLVDAFMPTALQFMPTEWLMYVFESRYFSEFLKEMTNQAYNGGLLSFGTLVNEGDVMGAMRNLAWTLGNQSGARQWFVDTLHDVILKTFSGSAGAEKAAEFSYKAGGVLLRWMELVDKALALIDVTTFGAQALSSQSANEWEVTVRAPKVLLSPAKMKLACAEKGGLLAQIKNGGQTLSGTFAYEFTNTARYGHLTSDVNPAYKDNFSATKPNVYYTANTTGLQNGGTDTIEVTVYLQAPNGSQDRQLKQLIGKAQAQITLASECSNSTGYVGNAGAYTSGCTRALSVPANVHPGDEVTVTASASYGGVCGTSSVWMSYAVSARLDGGAEQTTGSGGGGVYDFCYGGDPQPMVPGGVGVALPDDGTHTITFKIDPNLKCPVCVHEILDGTPCYSNQGNRQNISGPAVVMSGNGGTHGWSTVRFFSIQVQR